MDEIILVGAGGHARSCIDVIELSGQYKIAGLVEKDKKNGQESNECHQYQRPYWQFREYDEILTIYRNRIVRARDKIHDVGSQK